MLIKINKKYLCFPIHKESELHLIEIYCDNTKLYEFKIPISNTNKESSSYDYFAPINVDCFKGNKLKIVSKGNEKWLNDIIQSEQLPEFSRENRPVIHFTPDYGWINDPNGLVYYKGEYHLYFQYNPFDTKWENMSWGHAVSTDMLRWKQVDTVLWPDENGTMFSGSAIVNDKVVLDDKVTKDHLVYFYSAAGDANSWSKGKDFIQRIAISDDNGRTLKKLDYYIPTIEKENRDPKVFWHEESSAYIMILWLVDYEFAILRSSDLKSWTISQRFTIDKAWECPDLFQLENVDNPNVKRWAFWSADGYYCLGDFDGFTFKPITGLQEAYSTSLPYAAQTFSGIEDRVVSIAWLRTKNEGRLYTGAMTIPKELFIVTTKDGERLAQIPIREYLSKRKLIYDKSFKTGHDLSAKHMLVENMKDRVIEVAFKFSYNDKQLSGCYELFYGDEVCTIDIEKNIIRYEGCRISDDLENVKTVKLDDKICDLQIIFDHEIIEIIGNCGTIYAAFEAARQDNRSLSMDVPKNCEDNLIRIYEFMG